MRPVRQFRVYGSIMHLQGRAHKGPELEYRVIVKAPNRRRGRQLLAIHGIKVTSHSFEGWIASTNPQEIEFTASANEGVWFREAEDIGARYISIKK